MKQEFNIKKTIKEIDKEYNKQGVYLKPDLPKKKPFLMREPIHREGMTFIEKIEYWLFKRGLGGMKLFCKYYRTLNQNIINGIDIDTKDIELKAKPEDMKRAKIMKELLK